MQTKGVIIMDIDFLHELETDLNDLLWHLKVCRESNSTPCLNVVTDLAIRAKQHFDHYDNRESI